MGWTALAQTTQHALERYAAQKNARLPATKLMVSVRESQSGVAAGKRLLQPQGYITTSTYMLSVYITPRSALTNTTPQPCDASVSNKCQSFKCQCHDERGKNRKDKNTRLQGQKGGKQTLWPSLKNKIPRINLYSINLAVQLIHGAHNVSLSSTVWHISLSLRYENTCSPHWMICFYWLWKTWYKLLPTAAQKTYFLSFVVGL